MSFKNILPTFALALTVFSGVAAASGAHAGPILFRPRMLITVQSSNCLLEVKGSSFSPNGLVNVVVNGEGSHYGAFKMVQTTADATGRFDVTFGDDNLGEQVSIHAVNVTTHHQSAFDEEVIGCVK